MPDSFKGTLASAEVAAAIARGIRSTGASAVALPAGDGGEGTLDALLAAAGPAASEREVPVLDPLGREVMARLGLLAGDASGAGRGSHPTAVVELAQASGLGLVAPTERDAERASSRGTGELVVAAIAAGARDLLVTVGGSATTDGGIGALAAIYSAGGLRGARLTVLCDVTTPWERAAAVYAPQKGADAAAVARLAARLDALADHFPRDPRSVPRTGAAGGLAGGLWACLDAELVAGADAVLDRIGFDQQLQQAAAVVTGEGGLDAQTAEGKLAAVVAARGRAAGVPVHAIVGRSELDAAGAAALGLASVREAGTLAALEAAGARLAAELSA